MGCFIWQVLRGYNMGIVMGDDFFRLFFKSFFLVCFFFCFSVCGSFPCYLPHFGAKIFDLQTICCIWKLRSAILHAICSILELKSDMLHAICCISGLKPQIWEAKIVNLHNGLVQGLFKVGLVFLQGLFMIIQGWSRVDLGSISGWSMVCLASFRLDRLDKIK